MEVKVISDSKITPKRKRQFPSIRIMTPDEKEQHIKDLKSQLEDELDRKKRDEIFKRLDYVQKVDQRKQERKKQYIEKNKEALRRKYEEKLKMLPK